MADRRGLSFIGWAFGAITAAVIVISGLVVTASAPQADAAGTALSATAH